MRTPSCLVFCSLLAGCSDGSGDKKSLDAEVVLIATAADQFEIFWDVAFADATIGYAVGERDLFFKTVDGGSTWTRMPVPAELAGTPPFKQSIHAMHFESPTMGFAAGGKNTNQGFIAKSTDRGETWTIKTPFSNEFPEEIDFNGQIGLAVGNSGYAMRSADGGETWSKITTLPSTESFERIYMDDPARFYVASRSAIFYSTDQGLTWTAAPKPNKPTESSIFSGSLQMQSAMVGYTYNGGGLAKTTDGANSWQHIWRMEPNGAFEGSGFMLPEPDVLCFSQASKAAFYISRDGGGSYETFTIPEYSNPDVSLSKTNLWHKFAVNGSYLYTFTTTQNLAKERALYRIKYK